MYHFDAYCNRNSVHSPIEVECGFSVYFQSTGSAALNVDCLESSVQTENTLQ